MPDQSPRLPQTVSDLGKRFSVIPDRINYLVRTRRIPHIGFIGGTRVYDEAAAAQIELALVRIKKTRIQLEAELASRS